MKANFQDIISGETPVLIDFHAEWCGPCKAQAPVIKEVSQALSGKVRVIKIDIDKNPAIADKYQVRAVPTLALFNKGDLIWSQAGMMSKQQILNVLNTKLDVPSN